jgi:hypothetical protein
MGKKNQTTENMNLATTARWKSGAGAKSLYRSQLPWGGV